MASCPALPVALPALYLAAMIAVINYMLIMLCVTLTLISSLLLMAPGTPEIECVEQQAHC